MYVVLVLLLFLYSTSSSVVQTCISIQSVIVLRLLKFNKYCCEEDGCSTREMFEEEDSHRFGGEERVMVEEETRRCVAVDLSLVGFAAGAWDQ